MEEPFAEGGEYQRKRVPRRMIGARINVRERNRTELCCDGGRQGELRKDSRTVERTAGGKGGEVYR
jgi:hypothetical protein